MKPRWTTASEMMGLHAKGANGDDWGDGSDDVADDVGEDIPP